MRSRGSAWRCCPGVSNLSMSMQVFDFPAYIFFVLEVFFPFEFVRFLQLFLGNILYCECIFEVPRGEVAHEGVSICQCQYRSLTFPHIYFLFLGISLLEFARFLQLFLSNFLY